MAKKEFEVVLDLLESLAEDLPDQETLERIEAKRKEKIKNAIFLGKTSSGKDVYSYYFHPCFKIPFTPTDLLETIALFEKMESSDERNMAIMDFRNYYKRMVRKAGDVEKTGVNQ